MSLISKQIQDLRAYAKDRKGELAKLVSDAADTIEELSTKLSAVNMERSSQYYNGGWIPCSERLPDQYGNYLISIEKDGPDIGTINPNDPRGCGLCDANGFYWASDKALNITAWMPLPESYRGDEREND